MDILSGLRYLVGEASGWNVRYLDGEARGWNDLVKDLVRVMIGLSIAMKGCFFSGIFYLFSSYFVTLNLLLLRLPI